MKVASVALRAKVLRDGLKVTNDKICISKFATEKIHWFTNDSSGSLDHYKTIYKYLNYIARFDDDISYREMKKELRRIVRKEADLATSKNSSANKENASMDRYINGKYNWLVAFNILNDLISERETDLDILEDEEESGKKSNFPKDAYKLELEKQLS
jgi:hypothetical protein